MKKLSMFNPKLSQQPKMKNRVLLINPAYEYKRRSVKRYTRIWPPLDLAIAGALLEERGFSVSILDINAIPVSIEELIKCVKNYDKIFITSGSLDRWQCPHLNIDSFISTVKEVKKINENDVYIFGPHPTMRAKELLKETKADAAIIGEPELTIVELCDSNANLSQIKGIAYWENNEFKINMPRLPADLSKFPVPAFHLLPMKSYYYEIMGDKFTLLETTRGCPFLCTFCSEDQMYGIRYRKKSLELIEKEIDACVHKYGIKNIYFIDLEFTLIKSFVNDICDMLIKKDYDLRWACQTRADTVDLDLLKKMSKAGCKIIHYGVESGSPKILESTEKRITIEGIRKGVNLAKDVGIEVVCFCMMGLPKETIDDMKATVKFVKELNPDYVSFHVATPYPGTKLYESVKNEVKGLFPASYEGMYNEEFVKRMIRRAYLEFYLRPSYLFSKLTKNPQLLLKQIKLFLDYIS